MKRLLAAIVSTALLEGCAFLAPNPPPDIAEPPREGSPQTATPDNAATPVADVTPADPAAVESKPSERSIQGHWRSKSVTGPGSANVRSVELIFGEDGTLSGTMLIEAGGRKRFSCLEGTWREGQGRLAVTYSDGRARTWAVAWDEATLILKDGEGEMKMERVTG